MSESIDRTAPAALLDRPRLRRLLAIMNGAGEETRIVGGALRNALLGRPVVEIDLATTAVPAAITTIARDAGLKTVPTGIDHGTITVLVEGEAFEVTTLREDVETDGRRATVHFGHDFAADAMRRDFTINALSLGLDGTIHDYTDGVADLALRRVRFIGDARTRIREDYLRILRFFRFYAEYADGDADREGLAAAGLERSGLAILSRERIRHELLRILVARRARDAVTILAEHGFLTNLLGGAVERGRFGRMAENASAIQRLAALAVMVSEDADRLRDGLRLSNDEYGRLTAYARILATLKGSAPLDGLAIRRLVAGHGVETLSHARAAIEGEPRPVLLASGEAALTAFRSGAEKVPVFPLRGADLMEHKVPPGPEIGRLLEEARRLWLADGCRTDEASAGALLKRILQPG